LQKCLNVPLSFGVIFIDCHQHADAPHPLALLSARRERPSKHRAAEQSDRVVLTERLVEAGLTLVVGAQQFVDNDFARARGIRSSDRCALLAVCPNRLKNFSILEMGHTFKHVHLVDRLAEYSHQITPARRTSRPRMAEQHNRRVLESIAPRSSSIWVHDECALDILHDRRANDHKEPRYFGA
jgi:hypothetical protein